MPNNEPVSIDPSDNEASVNLVELAVRLIVEWRRWLVFSLIAFLCGALYISSIKSLYEANVWLLPRGGNRPAGLASLLNTRTTDDPYLSLLGSRSVLDGVVDRVDMLSLLKTKSREQARNQVIAQSLFSMSADGLLSIRVRDKNADTAMRIANAYVESLEHWQENSAARDAETRGRFFQQQVAKESEALANAEVELKKIQETTGLIEPGTQTQLGLAAIASTQTQITNLQVQLASMMLGSSAENPRVKELRSQIGALEAEERSLEVSNATHSNPGAAAAAGRIPQLTLDYSRKLREVKYHEAILNSLTTQYQVARQDENFGEASFKVVDLAVLPESKAWPVRRNLLLIDALLSAAFGLLMVILTLLWRRVAEDSESAAEFAKVRASFRMRG